MIVGRVTYVFLLVVAAVPVAIGAWKLATPPGPDAPGWRRWLWLWPIAFGVAAACLASSCSRPVVVASGPGGFVRFARRVELGARDTGTLVINESSRPLEVVTFLPFEGRRMASKETIAPGEERVASHRIDYLGHDDGPDPWRAGYDEDILDHTWIFADEH